MAICAGLNEPAEARACTHKSRFVSELVASAAPLHGGNSAPLLTEITQLLFQSSP
jgi:hypothetical protein